MRVMLLKEGRFCLHQSKGPVVDLDKGDELQVGDEIKDTEGLEHKVEKYHLHSLVESKWAKQIDDVVEKTTEEDEDVDNETAILLNELIAKETSEKDKKEILQKWGLENFKVKIGKNKKTEEMIAELCKAKDEFENNE